MLLRENPPFYEKWASSRIQFDPCKAEYARCNHHTFLFTICPQLWIYTDPHIRVVRQSLRSCYLLAIAHDTPPGSYSFSHFSELSLKRFPKKVILRCVHQASFDHFFIWQDAMNLNQKYDPEKSISSSVSRLPSSHFVLLP